MPLRLLLLLTLAAVSLPAPILRAQTESFDALLREATTTWHAKDLAKARQLVQQAVKLDDERWEGHHLLAQILLEAGEAADARESGRMARERLQSHMTKLDTFDSRVRQQAERLRDEAKAALAENDFPRAREKLAQALILAPALEGLAEMQQQLPAADRDLILKFVEASAKKGGVRRYAEERGRVVQSKKKYDERLQAVRAKKDREELEALIRDLDLGTKDPAIDAARDALNRGQLQEVPDILVSVLEGIVSNDPEAQLKAVEAALAAGDFQLVIKNLRPVANNRFYAPEALRIAKQVAKTAPDKAVPIFLQIRDLNDVSRSAAEVELEAIYNNDAKRVGPDMPRVAAAAEAKDGQRLFDLLAKYQPPIADPDFHAARTALQEGRADDAARLLAAVVERLQRVIDAGPVAVVRAEIGKHWTTSCGTPMRFVAPQQFTMAGRPVAVEKHFWIAERRVTRQEYLVIMQRAVWNVRDTGAPQSLVTDDVTYGLAAAFCDILTSKDREAGLIPEGYRYTLPTEAEYELAMRTATDKPDSGRDWCLANGQDLPYRGAAGRREHGRNRTFPVPDVSFRVALAHRGDG